LKQALDHLRLVLPREASASDRRHHFVAGTASALAVRIDFDILNQQLVGVQFGVVARQLKQAEISGSRGDEGLRQLRATRHGRRH